MTGAEGVVGGGVEPGVPFRGSPLSATQCGSCHPQHFEEWNSSFHARSITSENFLKTFPQYLDSLGMQGREDPQSSMACLGCHAPLLKHAGPEMIRQVRDFIVAKETKKLDGFEIGCVAWASTMTVGRLGVVISVSVDMDQEEVARQVAVGFVHHSVLGRLQRLEKKPSGKAGDNVPGVSHGRTRRDRRYRRTTEKNTQPCFSGWTLGRHAATGGGPWFESCLSEGSSRGQCHGPKSCSAPRSGRLTVEQLRGPGGDRNRRNRMGV